MMAVLGRDQAARQKTARGVTGQRSHDSSRNQNASAIVRLTNVLYLLTYLLSTDASRQATPRQPVSWHQRADRRDEQPSPLI